MDGCLAVTHGRIDVALGERQPFVLPTDVFQELKGVDGLVIAFLFLIQLEECLQQVITVLVVGIELLYGLCRFVILLLADVQLGQRLQEDRLVRVKLCGALDIFQGTVLVFEGRIVLCQVIIHLRCFGVELQAVAQQVEGCIVIALLALHHGLEEEIVVAVLGGSRQKDRVRGIDTKGLSRIGEAKHQDQYKQPGPIHVSCYSLHFFYSPNPN